MHIPNCRRCTFLIDVAESVATRLAFHGRSKVPLKAWEDFLAQVIRLDGRSKANSAASPAVQVETRDGALHCILPFGPAHWIRLDCIPRDGHSSNMGYAIQSSAELAAWSQTIQPQHYFHGLHLARRFGWFQFEPSSFENRTIDPIPPRRRGRPPLVR